MIKKSVKLTVVFMLVLLFSCDNNRITKEYYSEGNLKKEIYYSNNEIKKVVNYYPNGAVYSCSKFTNYDSGDCVITLYSTEGDIIGLMNYSGGVKHGEFIWYDTKGKILIEETYYKGVLVD